MFKTEICDILGIEYPIILGGMIWVGRSELVAAVSEAGGLGLLGAGGMMIQEIEQELNGVKEKTDKPFGVNIPLVRPDADEMIEASIKGGASVISTSAGNPKRYTQKIKDQGVKVIHVAFNVTGARKSAEAGADVVVVEGFEAGGHNGVDEMTTMAMVPQAVRAVDKPEEAARDVDIIVTATNSRQPFFPARYLSAGVHLSCLQRSEIELEAFKRCDPLFIHLNSAESNFTSALFRQRQKELNMEVRDHPWTHHQFQWDAYPTLGQLVTGQVEGRTDDAQISAFINNVGAGAQFAAVGAKVYELAKAEGIGRKLNSDLFLEDMHP